MTPVLPIAGLATFFSTFFCWPSPVRMQVNDWRCTLLCATAISKRSGKVSVVGAVVDFIVGCDVSFFFREGLGVIFCW